MIEFGVSDDVIKKHRVQVNQKFKCLSSNLGFVLAKEDPIQAQKEDIFKEVATE